MEQCLYVEQEVGTGEAFAGERRKNKARRQKRVVRRSHTMLSSLDCVSQAVEGLRTGARLL